MNRKPRETGSPSGVPPAWMNPNSTTPEGAPPPPPLPPPPPPAPALQLPGLPPIDPSVGFPPLATIPLPFPLPAIPAGPVPTLPPELTPVVLPLPAPTVSSPPPPVVISVPATMPSPTAAPGTWRPIVVGALAAVAAEKANSQFQEWANRPTDIYALVMSESGGSANAVKDEGYSTKLGRQFYAMGWFQMNELFCPGHYRDAPNMIGPGNARKMRPFPQTATWSKDQAAACLLAVPDQVWYPMVLLRRFSLFKNTWFQTVDGQTITAATSQSRISQGADPAIGKPIANQVGALARQLGVPASFILLKAFWLASSPAGVRSITASLDPRIKRAAEIWLLEAGSPAVIAS